VVELIGLQGWINGESQATAIKDLPKTHGRQLWNSIWRAQFFGQRTNWRGTPMTKLFAAMIATAAFVTPAIAEFFIIRDSRTGPCRIVAERPTDTKIVIVGKKDGYKEQTEAVRELAAVCK
jgi:hypothetical protein